jgi:hypothetical protein
MTFDHVIGVLEIGLLIGVVIQGEFIRYYEREVHRIQSDREKERRDWREAKRKQAVKKADKPEAIDGTAPKV